MFNFTFRGGVHPNDGKELSKYSAIKELKPTTEMVFPISQHIGALASPIVKKGDRVLVGQKIAEATGLVSANIHSSVSGTVKILEPRLVTGGSKVMSIVVDNDGEYEEITCESLGDTVVEAVKEAGVVGMGGACFPTHVKLSPKEPKKIEYIIVNGAECEPYLTSDYRRMLEEPDKIIEGLKIILSIFPNAKGIIGIEDNKKDVIKLMRQKVVNEPNIEVHSLITKYPQGAERQLIYAITKRKINSSMLPVDVGCIVDNVDTVYAIYNAVVEHKPLTSRIITVTGDGIANPQNFKAPIGINHMELVEEAGGLVGNPQKVISGGPMMGVALFDMNVPVIKGSSALLILQNDPVSECEQTNCINCGRCVEVCPGRVIPSRLADVAEHNDEEAFLKLNGMECCECGCCSFVCPAKRNVTQTIKSMRKDILTRRKK